MSSQSTRINHHSLNPLPSIDHVFLLLTLQSTLTKSLWSTGRIPRRLHPNRSSDYRTHFHQHGWVINRYLCHKFGSH